ncbi:hypothetical protein ACHAQH_001078 [Verticillium albo-atrum]
MPQARSYGAPIHEDHASSEEDLGLLADDPLADTHVKSPRTPNRVRFDLTPSVREAPAPGSSNGASSFDIEEPPAYFDRNGDDDHHDDDHHGDHQHHPLLTDIEAPSVALANSPWAEDEDVHDWAEQQRQRPKSGLRMAFMNMANSIIGAGIIGQPYAFKQAGLLAGVVLLVGLTFVVDWTICLIVINSKLSGSDSFQGTVQHCFGRPGLIAISVAQWAFAFGGMVAFGVIVGDSIPHVFLAIWPDLREMPVLWLLANRQFVIAVFVMGISFPLTLYRDISKVFASFQTLKTCADPVQLAKASTLALISMGVIVVTVVVQGLLTPRSERGSFTPALLTINGGIFEAIGVISFGTYPRNLLDRAQLTKSAFVCHHNSLLIYGSLKTPTIDRFSRVTHYSTGISMVFCLLMALAGFLTFGDKTLGNVLNNFPADNVMVTIARLCFGLNMLTTLPLEAFVCREVMFNYFYPGEPFNMRLHLIFSTALVGSATIISLITCDVGVVFELVGATSACAMAYILPPLCYIKLTTRSWRTYLAMAIVVFGTVVMCISLVQAVAKMVSSELFDSD